jgi:hypothetical protein
MYDGNVPLIHVYMSEQDIDNKAAALEDRIAKLQAGVDAIKKIIQGLQEERVSSPEATEIIDLQIANYTKAIKENEAEIEQAKKDYLVHPGSYNGT